MSSPLHISRAWEQIERRIRRSPRLAFFTDFDGTLVRIQRNPRNVRLSQSSRALLAGLKNAGVTVGIASGRAIEDVRARAGLNGIWYVGAHGYFLRDPENREFSLLRLPEQARMKDVIHALAVELRGLVGVELESKEASVAVHYRGASKPTRELVRDRISRLVNGRQLHLLAGKRVWELLPNSRVSKWTGIQFALKRAARRGDPRRPLLIFVGDDVTDERVFERIDGIGVVVGRKRKTAAGYYLRSPAEVGRFLEKVIDCIR
jgi:trehalose-phosphatase